MPDTLIHQRRAMIALLAWSGVSLAAGTGLLFLKRDPWTGIAIQSLAWGVIDGVIAAVALAKLPASYDDPAAAERSRRRFRKILLINTALDVVWVLVGAALVIWGNDTVRGHGYGVLAQGGFLLTFDGVNALLTY